MTTLEYLNAANEESFVSTIAFAFEDSPWIARAAAARRPFADLAALHAAMVGVVQAADPVSQVALIAAHPDLAGRVAREGRLEAASTAEQAAAGLDALTPSEIARFDADNAAYRDKTSILAELQRRGQNERSDEIATALEEIAKIARLRLEAVVRR